MFSKNRRITELERRIGNLESIVRDLDNRMQNNTHIMLPQQGYTVQQWGVNVPLERMVRLILSHLGLEYKSAIETETLVKKEDTK